MITYRGKITEFTATRGSGMAALHLDTADGQVRLVCENGATVRALDDMFEGAIVDGHSLDLQMILGREVVAEAQDYGGGLLFLSTLAVASDDV